MLPGLSLEPNPAPGRMITARFLDQLVTYLESRSPGSSAHAFGLLPAIDASSRVAGIDSRRGPAATSDAQSVGAHITFGRFRVLHLGDLTANKEFDLMCPANRLGEVDLFAKIPHGSGQTYLRELLLVADHNAYHVGQFVALLRRLGGWVG